MRLLITTIVFLAAAYVFPGIHVANFWAALVAALALIIVSFFIKPVLIVLTLPINFITLGLFTFVINASLILLVSLIVPGFTVDGFWWALLLAVILSVVRIAF